MWWTALIQVAQSESAAPNLPAYAQQYTAQQQQSSDWPIIVAALAGIGIAGVVAWKVLR